MNTVLSGRPDKRRRRTKAQVETLDDQIMSALKADHPQSVRHVYYLMTNPRLSEPVEKTDAGYSQVQSRITLLRRSGRLPYGWISDMSRRGYHVDTFDGASDFLRRVAGLYREDLWRDAEHYCEVWAESRSIASVVQADCNELAVSLYPCGGFSSLSFAYQAAEYINAAVRKPAVLFYVGDYDPAGILISQSLEQELRAHLRPGIDLTFHRLGITKQQIEEFDLPTNGRKPTEKRLPHIKRTCEAEAMPAHIIRELVRNAVEALLPQDALAIAKVAEESERETLLIWAEP
jgi:hypothetical protein